MQHAVHEDSLGRLPTGPSEPTPAIAVTGLTKQYGRKEVVSDLTFSVLPGRVTGYLGPNGSGKTTTMRMILGLVRPTRGTSTVAGRPFTQLERPASRVGVLLEGAQAHPGRTARDHLSILATQRGVDPARIDLTLERVHLTEARDNKVRGFSLGMRQRLDLAAALLGEPDILLLDEPANGLDPAGIRWLRSFLRSFADDGGTVFVSSHQLDETSRLADDVIVIDQGRLVTHTSVAALTAQRLVRVRSPRIRDLENQLRRGGAEIRHSEDDAIELTGFAIEQVGAMAATSQIELHELSTRAVTLEGVFLDLTTGDQA